ncbi:MAG: hypothetical protein ACTSYB_13015 [Candidatus Helarchaeota archaeon]|mgnify:CR=1 FL=1
MVTIQDMENMFKDVVEQMNSKERFKKRVRKWIGTYYGKIIGWNFGEKSFHLIFMKDGTTKLGYGEYPASETIILTDPETWFNFLLKGFEYTKKAMAEGKIWIRGNFHELIALNNVCIPIMQKFAMKLKNQ